MAFLLILLLAAIALIITLVGYLLTPPKTQLRNQRTAYQAGYNINRSGRRVPFNEPTITRRVRGSDSLAARRVRRSEPVATPRAVAYTEQNTLLEMWQSLAMSRMFKRRSGEPTSWAGITLVLLSVFLLGIFLMKTLMPNATLIGAFSWPSASTSSASNSNPASDGPYTASRNLERISQLDPAQYNSPQEYNLWAYSACSAAAMTEVLNAYGHHYRVTDILKIESQIGEITPQLGLLEDIGIERTAARFGFKTSWGHKLSLDDMIGIANHGRPVIVSFPPDRYDGGHLLVVIGGNSSNVLLADSSRYNRQVLSRTQFMQWWEGFSAVVTPD